MLLKMLRSQKTIVGLLLAGVVYKFDDENFDQVEVRNRLLESEPPLAEKITAKEMKAAKLEAEKLADNGETKTEPAEKSQAEKLGDALLAGRLSRKERGKVLAELKKEKDAEKVKNLEALLAAAESEVKASQEILEAAGCA